MYTKQFDLSIGIIPTEILRQLRKHEIVIIDSLCDLWNLSRLNNPNDSTKCWPGEEYLAEKAGVTRWTVSRSIQRLKRFGLLQAWQRRRKNNTYRTNVYYLGPRMHKAVTVRIHRALEYVKSRLRAGATNKVNFYKTIKKEELVDNFRGRKLALEDP